MHLNSMAECHLIMLKVQSTSLTSGCMSFKTSLRCEQLSLTISSVCGSVYWYMSLWILIEVWASDVSKSMIWCAEIVDFQRSMNFFLPTLVKADAITSPHSIVIPSIGLVEETIQLQVPYTLFAFFAMRSAEVLFQVLIMLK